MSEEIVGLPTSGTCRPFITKISSDISMLMCDSLPVNDPVTWNGCWSAPFSIRSVDFSEPCLDLLYMDTGIAVTSAPVSILNLRS